MHAITVSEMLSALTRAYAGARSRTAEARRHSGWDALGTLLDEQVAGEGAVLDLWQRLVICPDEPALVRRLAVALVEEAREKPDLVTRLREWAHDAERTEVLDDGWTNTIAGTAQLHGPTVQARDVHGGVHIHPQEPSVPTPRQLPAPPAHLTGRQEDVASLHRMLEHKSASAPLLVVVSGPPGVGKTTLVSAWLRQVGVEFPDGHLYVDLCGYSPEGPARPTEVLGRLLRAMDAGPVPADVAERSVHWRTVTDQTRTVVLLDNAFSAAQVRPLLPGGSGNLVVVTSRRRLTGLSVEGAEAHRLGMLDQEAGTELLTRYVGRARVETEQRDAHRLVDLCGGLPLALRVVAARLATRPRMPLATMVETLAHEPGRLSALEVEGDPAVLNALDTAYATLTPQGARLYRRLGLLPTPTFDGHVAATVCARSLPEAEHLLDELFEANLMEENGPDTWRFHDLVRDHARGRALAEMSLFERQETLRRACDWYLSTATAAEERLTPAQYVLRRDYVHPPRLAVPFADDAQALAWLDTRRDQLMGAMRSAADLGWHDLAWQLADAAWPLFLRLRYYDLWIEAHEIGLTAARRSGDRAAERQMLNSGAIGLGAAGRVDDAIVWYRESAQAAQQSGDVRDEGQAMLGLGGCHHEAGRFQEAEAHLNQAIALWEGCGYPRGVALAQVLMGEVALSRGEPERAVQLCAQAVRTFAEVHDPHDEARALAFLGHAHNCAGEYAAGTAALHQALNVFTSSGANHWQARTLEMLGQGAESRGDFGEARSRYASALDLHVAHSRGDAARLRDRLAQLPT